MSQAFYIISNSTKFFLSGFLGLLMGGSLLSLVEIFYHLTLKRIFKRKLSSVDVMVDVEKVDFNKLKIIE